MNVFALKIEQAVKCNRKTERLLLIGILFKLNLLWHLLFAESDDKTFDVIHDSEFHKLYV